MKVTVQPYNSAAGIYFPNGSGQKKAEKSGDFQSGVMAQAAGSGKERCVTEGVSGRTSELKNEILSRFPNLKEEKLDQLMKDYDIESMDSEELFKLAGELMEEEVIPSRPDEGELNQIAVFPKELYLAWKRGEISQPAATIRPAADCCYAVNPGSGELAFGYPAFGIRNLQYDLKLCQDAFKRFESYYTDDERMRQVQLTNSKARFLELAKMLAAYKEEL